MSGPKPQTQTLEAEDARARWSDILRRVFHRQTRVLVEEGGIPVAAIVSTEDLERLNQLDAEIAADLAVLDAAQQCFADVRPEELEARIAQAIAEARAERRAQGARTDQ